MLRWILVLALFGLAGLVLYYQYSQRANSEQAAFQSGYVKGTEEQRPSQLAADSLRDSLTRLVQEKGKRDTAYRQLLAINDSLESVTSSQSARIEKLSKPRTAIAETKGAGKPAVEKPLTSHSQVLAYYKKRYDALPADLSTYERQVALREIRQEAAKKFAMTLTEFEKIRNAEKLP